jgi:transcriptional regulator with XRE-family HTH domain
MDDATAPHVGARIRDIRTWRDVSLRVTAELAGISPAYLSMIENGERAVQRRSTLEAIARALRVSPTELGALPTTGVLDPDVSRALDSLVDVESALTDVQLGEQTVTPRPWDAVAADVQHLYTVLRPRGDIAAQMELLPGLIRELNALVSTDPAHRRQALEALMLVLLAAGLASKYVGSRGTPGLAAMHMRDVAEELDEPRWLGLAMFSRAQTLGSGARRRSRELSLLAVQQLQPHLADEPVRQLVGMLHLNASLASAALDEPDVSATHLQEAQGIADSAPDPAGSGWANLSFCRTNVAFWEVALTLETGDPGKVPELARNIQPERVASWSRQGAFYADLGRALATSKGTRDDAVVALARAEQLSPVSTRANVWARESVRDLLVRVKRDTAVGRELRGMAYRMGLAA